MKRCTISLLAALILVMLSLPALAAPMSVTGEHDIGAMLHKGIRLVATIHTDHQPEAAVAPSFDANERILDDHGPLRRDAETPGRFQESVWQPGPWSSSCWT